MVSVIPLFLDPASYRVRDFFRHLLLYTKNSGLQIAVSQICPALQDRLFFFSITCKASVALRID